MTDKAQVSFNDLEIPLELGSTYFEPIVDAIKKLAYSVEDESGWLLGDPADEMVNPYFLSAYQWWPSGFYYREPWARGLFSLFQEQYPWLVKFPFLHAKATARFFSPFRARTRIRADVSVIEKYQKRGRDYIVMRSCFFDANDTRLAEFDHTVAIRSDAVEAGSKKAEEKPAKAPAAPAPVGLELPKRVIAMSLEKTRLFTLPAENFHTHDRAAQARGYRVAMPAAMMCFAYLSKHAHDFFGPAWLASGEISATFVQMFPRDAILTVHGNVVGSSIAPKGVRTELVLGVKDAEGRTITAGTASALTA